MLEAGKLDWERIAPAFAAALLDPNSATPAFLTSVSGVNDPLRYDIYRNNVTVSLVRAIEANFPSIVRLVGAEYFGQLAQLFVQTHPPRTRLMFEYGTEFPAFLDEFEPLKAYPYLGDVARIEEAWRAVFHEADAKPLDGGQMQSVEPDAIANLVFVAHPATRLIRSFFAAGSIFVANRADGAKQPDDPFRPECVLVTRPHFDCAVRILDGANGVFVEALVSGATLGDATAAAFAKSGDFNLSVAISGAFESGLFQGFDLA